MKSRIMLCAVAATVALTAAVPAFAAKPAHPVHPTHPSHPAYPIRSTGGKSQKCTAHEVAYIASGKLVSWSATAGAKGTYSGTVVIDVTRANHHAKGAKGTDETFTLSGAKVRFGKGATVPAAGDRVSLTGKITLIAKKCTNQTGAGIVTVRRVFVKTPAKK